MKNTEAAPTTTIHNHYASRDIDPNCNLCGLAQTFRPLVTEANQTKLDRLMVERQSRIAVGTVINNRRGTARWNGLAWVYGK